MLALPGILLIAIVVVVAIVASQRRDRTPRPAAGVPTDLRRQLADWVAAGLVSNETAEAIVAHERARLQQRDAVADAGGGRALGPESTPAPLRQPALSQRVPLVAEALGYLGGALAIVGVALLVARYWTDLGTAARLAVCGVGAVGLFAAGALANEAADPAFARLRWFTWLASTAAGGLFAGVALHDGFDVGREPRFVAAGIGAGALYAAVLWAGKNRPVQQSTALGGAVVAVGVAIGEISSVGSAGLAVWAMGAAYLAVWFAQKTPQPLMTGAIGAAATVAGSILTGSDWSTFGIPFALATGAALTALVLVPGLVEPKADQLAIGIIGTVCLVQALPSTLGYFGQDGGAATGLATWSVGVGLLALGARRLVRLPLVVEVVGGAAILGGGALTGVQWPGFAPLFGVVTALGLIALGVVLAGRVLLSVLGSVGLLVNVPWAIAHFFPGEGRAPLLILVSGALILGVAVLLARLSPRLRSEIGRAPLPAAPPIDLDVSAPDLPPTPPPLPGDDTAPSQPPARRTGSPEPGPAAATDDTPAAQAPSRR